MTGLSADRTPLASDFSPSLNLSKGLAKLASERYKIAASPLFCVVEQGSWLPVATHQSSGHLSAESLAWREPLRRIVETVADARDRNELFGADGRTSPQLIAELAKFGLWGCTVDRTHHPHALSGEVPPTACRWSDFFSLLTRLATIAKPVAGVAAIHQTIGALRAIDAFGTPQQRREWLPKLVAGESLSSMAMTEPAAGSDLSAIRTVATRDGDELLLSGEKCFITGMNYGATALLITRLDQRPAAAILPIPQADESTISLIDYPLHPLKHSHNRGVLLQSHPLPAANLLEMGDRSGLSAAYYGLNYGRVGVAALAAGHLRSIVADLLPWVRHRHTFGQPIGSRSLVKQRLARAVSLVVACDAMVEFCSHLHDQEYRVELEAIVAKVFATSAVKEAAIDLALKTHGGRSLLVGHPIGDSLHDYLAATIYEGEGDLLSLSLLRSLASTPLNLESAETPAAIPEATDRALWLDVLLQEFRTDLAALRARFASPWEEAQVQSLALSARFQKLVVARVVLDQLRSSSDEVSRLAAELLVDQSIAELRRQPMSDDLIERGDHLATLVATRAWERLHLSQPAELMFPYSNDGPM